MTLLPLILLFALAVLGVGSWLVIGALVSRTTSMRMVQATVPTRPIRLSRRQVNIQ
jgi:hypothetical protein